MLSVSKTSNRGVMYRRKKRGFFCLFFAVFKVELLAVTHCYS